MFMRKHLLYLKAQIAAMRISVNIVQTKILQNVPQEFAMSPSNMQFEVTPAAANVIAFRIRAIEP